jgi:hypothetical protein
VGAANVGENIPPVIVVLDEIPLGKAQTVKTAETV